MRRGLALTTLLVALPARAAPPEIRIEKATIAWNDLRRLIEAEGDAPPASPAPTAPPHSYASTAAIDGQIEGDTASLHLVLDLEVLAEHWVLVPVLPANLAVASAQVDAPLGRRGLLVRESSGVLMAASGAGHYRVTLEAEGSLERGARGDRLMLPLPGLTAGQAHLSIGEGRHPSGKTPWRVVSMPGGRVEAEAVLGRDGLDLTVGAEDLPAEASGSLDGLSALSVVSLGGEGVTRLLFHATPTESGALTLKLPPGGRLWKAFVNGKPVDVARMGHGESVEIALRRPSDLELTYTFAVPPFGLRGHLRVELPRWPFPVRDSSWQLWLPSGLRYSEIQAALTPLNLCGTDLAPARTPLTPRGECLAFARPVLESGVAYVESAYEQPL